MEIVWDIFCLAAYIGIMLAFYKQGKLLKIRAQIIEHLEWQVDTVSFLVNTGRYDGRDERDAPVVSAVAYMLGELHAARIQRDHLKQLLEKEKAKMPFMVIDTAHRFK